MKTVQCSNCGAGVTVVRGAYRFKESGLRNVTLRDVKLARCNNCGNEDPIIPGLNGLMRTLALSVVLKPYRLEGNEVRFLRKYLMKTQGEFSKLIHVDKTTLSKWENDDDPIGEQSDLLVRLVAVGLADDLKEKSGEVVREFENISDTRRNVRIEINSETLAYHYA